MSLRGYWRTASVRIDCRPAIRITRFTTTARTGRLTKRSVSFIGCLPISGRGPSVVFRLRSGAASGLDLIVHLDGDAVPQLEEARGDDLLTRPDAGGDGNQVAPL